MAKWLKSTDCITFEVRDRIAFITMNRPDKRNALSPELITEVHDAMLEADDLTAVHVIVLQRRGAGFLRGLRSRIRQQPGQPGRHRRQVPHPHRHVRRRCVDDAAQDGEDADHPRGP
jgi:enoyl-CoA hydratase/carnithine racemase